MKNKKWLLLLIIALPSIFWFLLETSTINWHKLNYYGPKKKIGKDSIYYCVPDTFRVFPSNELVTADTVRDPIYLIMFARETYSNEAYRMAGLWEYLNYKKEKVESVPFFIVTEAGKTAEQNQLGMEELKKHNNVKVLSMLPLQFDEMNRIYMKEKPYYIDYSFFMMIDRQRHIRGYYDGRYASEIKRLIDEYRHLRLKEEKQKLINENEIKPHS
jgi:hypothetical protein